MIDSVEICFDAAREERDASLEALGMPVPAAPGSVPRRKGSDKLPQPARALLTSVRDVAAERRELVTRIDALAADLERDVVLLYESHGVTGTAIAEMTGMSRKWVYDCLSRNGVDVRRTERAA